jgi:hypothetical protein
MSITSRNMRHLGTARRLDTAAIIIRLARLSTVGREKSAQRDIIEQAFRGPDVARTQARPGVKRPALGSSGLQKWQPSYRESAYLV